MAIPGPVVGVPFVQPPSTFSIGHFNQATFLVNRAKSGQLPRQSQLIQPDIARHSAPASAELSSVERAADLSLAPLPASQSSSSSSSSTTTSSSPFTTSNTTMTSTTSSSSPSSPAGAMMTALFKSELPQHLELSLLAVCNRILLTQQRSQFDRASFRELIRSTARSEKFQGLSLVEDEVLDELTKIMDLNNDGSVDTQEIKCCSSVLSPVRSFEERLVLIFTAYDVEKTDYFPIPLLFDLLSFVNRLRLALKSLDPEEYATISKYIDDLHTDQFASLSEASTDDRPGYLSRDQFFLFAISDDRLVRLLSGTAVDRTTVAPIVRRRERIRESKSPASQRPSPIQSFAQQKS